MLGKLDNDEGKMGWVGKNNEKGDGNIISKNNIEITQFFSFV